MEQLTASLTFQSNHFFISQSGAAMKRLEREFPSEVQRASHTTAIGFALVELSVVYLVVTVNHDCDLHCSFRSICCLRFGSQLQSLSVEHSGLWCRLTSDQSDTAVGGTLQYVTECCSSIKS